VAQVVVLDVDEITEEAHVVVVVADVNIDPDWVVHVVGSMSTTTTSQTVAPPSVVV
jgi:hypothetical protein